MLTIVLIILGTIFQNGLTFRTGLAYDFGIGFWGPLGHDGIWHQALVKQLTKNIPPNNPTFSGTTLTGYHYYYDLLVALIHQITGLSVEVLIYQVLPIIFSVLLGVLTWKLSQRLFKSKLATVCALFFVYFGSSLGWIVELVRGGFWGGESTFWANQPVSMNLNPPFAMSLVMMVGLLILVDKYFEKSDWKLGGLIAIVAGLMIGVKAYAGILVLGGLLLTALLRMVREKKPDLLLMFLGGLGVALLVFWPNLQDSASLLVFSPLWFVHSMIDFADRIGWARLSSARTTYFSGKMWGRFFFAEILGLTIFIVGNLGTRMIMVFSLPKKIFKSSTEALIFWMAVGAFGIPLLFIQKGNTWNTIQFLYYFLFFAALYAGSGLAKLKKMMKKQSYWLLVVGIVLLTPPSSLATFKSSFSQRSPTYLPFSEQEALEFLEKQEDGAVLTYPFEKNLRGNFTDPYPLLAYETTAYVSAYSGKETYLTDLIQQEIFQNDFEDRLANQRRFFVETDKEWMRSFLKENNIAYIYLPKVIKNSLRFENDLYKRIFENDEVNVYQVIE